MLGYLYNLDVMQISCYDTAGSVLLLGCTNGCIYYIDMQKFPLRMKDNDLLITELYRDPNQDVITAISVYLTPKTSIQQVHSMGYFPRFVRKLDRNRLWH